MYFPQSNPKVVGYHLSLQSPGIYTDLLFSDMSSLLINPFLVPKQKENTALSLRSQLLFPGARLEPQEGRVLGSCVINALTIWIISKPCELFQTSGKIHGPVLCSAAGHCWGESFISMQHLLIMSSKKQQCRWPLLTPTYKFTQLSKTLKN